MTNLLNRNISEINEVIEQNIKRFKKCHIEESLFKYTTQTCW